MDKDTVSMCLLGIGLFASLTVMVFLLTRNTSTVFVRDSEGRITEIHEVAR